MTTQGTTNQRPRLPFRGFKVIKQFKILKTLVEWYRKNKKPVMYKDIAGIHGSKTNVSSTLSYYASIDWLIEKTSGAYIPSDDLVQYFEGIDKVTPSLTLVKNIQNTMIGKKLFFFITQKGKATKEEIVEYLGSEFKLKEKDGRRIIKLLEILILLNALKSADKFLEVNKSFEESTLKQVILDDVIPEDVEVSKEIKLHKIPVFISILINPDTDEEKVRSCIRIVLEEIEARSNYD